MSSAKFDVEKFTGKNDFSLWRIKMKALLVQQGLSQAIKTKSDQMTDEQSVKWQENQEKAHSAIVLCLADSVLREVSHAETALEVWQKLQDLYLQKSLASRLYMKQRLYSFRILEDRPLGKQLNEFHKILDDLENVEVKLQDEDKAILLLSALPEMYDNLVDAMLYGRLTAITLKEVICALKTKELQKAHEESREVSGEGLLVKSKFTKNKNYKRTKTVESKTTKFQKKIISEKENRKCFDCEKTGHLKKDCYLWKRQQNHKNQEANQTKAVESEGEPEVLNIMDSEDSGK